MGYLISRKNKHGLIRYTAMYLDANGNAHSCGTFASEKDANRKWQDKEAAVRAGKIGDAKRGKQTFIRYVTLEWFPNHLIEVSTRGGYQIMLDRYLLPFFGTMRMTDILPGHVRQWIISMQRESVNPPTIQKAKVVFDSIFTTALNDQITMIHPGRGVKIPAVVSKPRRIVSAEQFDTFYAALADPTMRLLVETDIESGLRWGEITELRPGDIDFGTGILTVSRAVIEVELKLRENGQRFVVKNYPKNQKWRQLKLPRHLLEKIKDHVASRGLAGDDLLFTLEQPGTRRRSLPDTLPDPEELGFVPNERGHRYRHGTTSGYTKGKCRCEHCRNAMSAYRAARRANGKDDPREARTVDTDGHVGNDWFRHNIWNKALAKSGLPFRITPHSLRHAHASWLVAGGADLQVVKARLGHGTIRTTERYLHELPNAGDSALTAMENYRSAGTNHNGTGTIPAEDRSQFHEVKALIEEMKTSPAETPLQQLRSLAELRKLGIITGPEFETKKIEILARI